MSKQCEQCVVTRSKTEMLGGANVRRCWECPEGFVPRNFVALQPAATPADATDRLIQRYSRVRSCVSAR